MEYNTEVIKRVAEEIAEMIKRAVIGEQTMTGSLPGIAQIEGEMREAMRQIGQQSLSLLLSGMQTTPEIEIACKCGGTLKYQRMREASVISVFGKTSYKRAYYAGCNCQKGKAPLDEQFGLTPGAVTAGLSQLLALAGIEFSFDESMQWLRSYLLFTVSENTVRAETERMGSLQEQCETGWIQDSQDEAYLQERLRQPGRIAPRMYGSIDAAKVRIEPRPKKGAEKEAHEDWRDMKIVCWFETENVPASQRSKRQQKKVLREQAALRAQHMQYFCDIAPAEEFGKLLWGTGCRVNADLCPDLIFLGDGAVWIWNLVSLYYPHAVQILDWYHAEEHLEVVAQAVFSDSVQRSLWLEENKQALWDGQVEAVISACQKLALSDISQAAQAANYFTSNIDRMRYDRFRAAGYMIGSGTVESACKQIVSQRLKLPGAQWSVDGAVFTAKARASWLSGHWHSLCQRRSALPLAI